MASLENAVKSMASALDTLETTINRHQDRFSQMAEVEMIAKAQLSAALNYNKTASLEVSHIRSGLKSLEARLQRSTMIASDTASYKPSDAVTD